MDLYSVREIAEVFGVKEETVRWWRYRDPAFPPVVRVGRSWALTRSRLDAWLAVKSADSGIAPGAHGRQRSDG